MIEYNKHKPGKYRLMGPDGIVRPSRTKGVLGGNRQLHIYGRLDCSSALRWIKRGHYVAYRVFFASELAALAAGYRPCARCLPVEYAQWKELQDE